LRLAAASAAVRSASSINATGGEHDDADACFQQPDQVSRTAS
jgi:hypothetical protein